MKRTQVVTSVDVPSVLSEIGATTKASTPPLYKCKIALKARYGHGTSTFIAGNPKAVILDFRNEAHSCKRMRACRINVKSYDLLEDALVRLIAGKKTQRDWPYNMVWFDRATNWQRMLQQQIIDEWNQMGSRASKPEDQADDIGDTWGGRGGYSRMADRAQVMIDKLTEVGYGVGTTIHLVDKTQQVGREEVVVTVPNLYNTFAERILGGADLRMTLTHTMNEVARLREVKTKIGGKETTTKVNDGTEVVEQYILDFESVGDARQGGSRVQPPRLILPKYKDADPSKTTNWDRLEPHYEAERQLILNGKSSE